MIKRRRGQTIIISSGRRGRSAAAAGAYVTHPRERQKRRRRLARRSSPPLLQQAGRVPAVLLFVGHVRSSGRAVRTRGVRRSRRGAFKQCCCLWGMCAAARVQCVRVVCAAESRRDGLVLLPCVRRSARAQQRAGFVCLCVGGWLCARVSDDDDVRTRTHTHTHAQSGEGSLATLPPPPSTLQLVTLLHPKEEEEWVGWGGEEKPKEGGKGRGRRTAATECGLLRRACGWEGVCIYC